MSFKIILTTLFMSTYFFASVGFAQQKMSIENWHRLTAYLDAQEEKTIKFVDPATADGSRNETFMASTAIGIIVGTENIKKDKDGNTTTIMWDFVASSDDGKMTRFLHRVVVKDSENVVSKIEGIDATDSENEVKLEELKTDLLNRIAK
jgi:hypothetical protein